MLVLSRQKKQRVNFPGLGISVEILDIKGSKVKVGVDAPMEVRILRDEIEDHGAPPEADAAHVVRLPQAMRHDLRNALHELSLMLHVYRKRAEQTHPDDGAEQIDPERMFEAIVERLENLSGHGALSSHGVVSPVAATGRPNGRAALVVDDDSNERELLAGFLRMCDYDVSTASDGLDALRFLEENDAPRVILLDMNMPKCDGQAFLRRVRRVQAWDPINVFVVSGSTPHELGLNPADGYTHWFHKPLDPRLVVEKLAEIEAVGASVA
ncbi:MAG: response regulator [Planctomycetota bacterium]